jgi:hypothetical protein
MLNRIIRKFVDPVKMMTDDELSQIYAGLRMKRQKTKAQAATSVDIKRRVRCELWDRGREDAVSSIDRRGIYDSNCSIYEVDDY